MRIALFVTVVCLSIVVAAGCGKKKGDRVTVYPVQGRISVKGQPAEGVSVTFYAEAPAPERVRMPIPSGVTDANGAFQLTSYERGDGAPSGSYIVTAVWDEKPPANFTDVFEPKDHLQGRYSSPEKSKLKAQVPDGGGEIPPFELK